MVYKQKVVLVGLESRYIYDVLDIIDRCGRRIEACVRSEYDTEICGDLPSLANSLSEVSSLAKAAVLVPLLTPGRKKRVVNEAQKYGLIAVKALIDPSAVVSGRSHISEGSIVGPAGVVASNCQIGVHVAINRAASIGHDCLIADYSSVGPGATLSGGCQIDEGVFIGSGAVLAPKVRVGRNAVVGSGAVVIADVPSNTVVAGNPARVIRTDVLGYRDIGV